jgi:hypothetical protein
MSKLFSPLSLVDEHTSIVSVRSTDSYIDESFFVETLDFLTEQNREFSFMNARLYKNINESTNDPIVIRESFSEFFTSVKNFIKKIIKFLKKLIAKFWVRINSLFMRDKYIEAHKDQLAKFSSDHEFDISGYNFGFDEDIPSINVLQNLDQSIADFKIDGKAKSKDDLQKAYDAFIDKKNSNNYLDNLRKECIKAKSNIDEVDFKDALFKVYRSGDKSKIKLTVTNAIVTEALAFFTNYEKMKTSTQRHADNVERVYNSIQKNLNKVNQTTVDGINQVSIDDFVDNGKDVSTDKIALYDLFMKAKSQEIQLISNMHLMAFSAKLDALKECFDQDKKIMYGAFKKILAKSESVDLWNVPDYPIQEKSDISNKERKELPDSAFGLPKDRKYPLRDENGKVDPGSVKSAIKLFGHCPDEKKAGLAKRIRSAAKEGGVKIDSNTEIAKYIREEADIVW